MAPPSQSPPTYRPFIPLRPYPSSACASGFAFGSSALASPTHSDGCPSHGPSKPIQPHRPPQHPPIAFPRILWASPSVTRYSLIRRRPDSILGHPHKRRGLCPLSYDGGCKMTCRNRVYRRFDGVPRPAVELLAPGSHPGANSFAAGAGIRLAFDCRICGGGVVVKVAKMDSVKVAKNKTLTIMEIFH